MPQKLLVASTNFGKLKEFRALFADLPIEWLSLADVGLDHMHVEETGETFIENALLKANAYSAAAGLPTVADDSGLVVDALDGAPGVYSARFGPTAEERNQKLLTALEQRPQAERSARFMCAVAVVIPDGVTAYAVGRLEGWIGFAPRGSYGFGFDPVFEVGDGRTLAELPPEEKNQRSHRGQAIAKLSPVLRALFHTQE